MPSLTAVYFVATVSGAVFFGAYLILMFTALYLLSRRERTSTTIVMVILTVVMFAVSATSFALDIVLVSDGILHPHKYPGTVINLFGPEMTTQIICRGINSILGDSIVIWRAWVVWGRRLPVVTVPLIFLVGIAFSSIGMAFAQAQALHDPGHATAFRKYMIALPCLTLATNLAATSLVLSRIFVLQFSMRRAKRLDWNASIIGHGGVRYRRLLKILIESGGMYCLTWLILLCLILTGSTAAHVFLSIIGQLMGIYPTLIIVLVSLNLTQERDQGPVKLNSNIAPESTFARTVSYTVAHSAGSSGASSGDGVAFVTRAGCGVDASKTPNYESTPDMKGYVVYQVTEVSCDV